MTFSFLTLRKSAEKKLFKRLGSTLLNDIDSSLSMTDEGSGRHEDEGMPWVDTSSVERRRSSRRDKRKARGEMLEFIV